MLRSSTELGELLQTLAVTVIIILVSFAALFVKKHRFVEVSVSSKLWCNVSRMLCS